MGAFPWHGRGPVVALPPGMRCMSSNLYKIPTLAKNNTCSSLRGARSDYRQLQRFSTSRTSQNGALDRTRNIGIIAHIDAGKTTTTERMLFYSGFTRRIGDVDEGSTVTDFLPAERARGITIQSAAITFHWPPGEVDETSGPQTGEQNEKAPRSSYPHTINLIDTPGHADFTFEVMRSLRILDGAVCILDGVAGVEAQTEKVWNQASTYRIPRVIYVNKLDRDGAAFGRTVREVSTRLGVYPAVCQIPWFHGGNGPFVGVADAINLQGLRWKEGEDGRTVKMSNLEQLEAEEPALAAELRRARIALVELLSEHDEDIVEKFFECEEDHLAVLPADIIASLRRCVLDQSSRIVPLFAGASFRNMGVQPLLDSVVNLLPSPPEAPDPEVSISGVKGGLRDLLSGDLIVEQSKKASVPAKGKQPKRKHGALQSSSRDAISKLQSCALAFKVVNDAKRGVLVYVRVYSGSLDRNSLLYNTNLQISERAPRLLKMYANDAVEVDSIPAGHIGVVVGLKQTRTGDTLVSYSGNKATPPEPLISLQLRPIAVPPPVFFTSVEPHSLSEEKRMHESLALLLREDPSLHVSVDEESGQTLLSGMGELHLEIARDRLINDLKAKASMGRIEIGYRESTLGISKPITKLFDKEIAGRKGKACCTAVVEPLDEQSTPQEQDEATLLDETYDGNQIIVRAPGLQIDRSSRTDEETSPFLPPGMDTVTFRTALQNGAMAALARGPQFTFPMHNTRVTLTINPATDLFGNETTTSALSSAARQATAAALQDVQFGAGTTMMEPVMNVIISVDEASLGSVVHDISSSRGGHIISLDEEVPLAGTDAAGTSESALEEEAPPPIDPSRVYAPPDPFETPSVGEEIPAAASRPRTIIAKVPLKEMVGYLRHLRSLTAGRGTFVMTVDRFENMSAQRQKAVLTELRGGF
ncbi:Translation elongation/initiation factor/Ribosomal beta-barrel [Penicillium bovifimosum]|uniref:Ribosome-releasing factor 2, mitochondrial n=1 Tax=Penicillium bovifimosum TaxID=126998 RepID=A0A9W9HG29_9EURO|nr:Translation elongation/initiation factor/Ribosomal beta-barrel [Penicillium bovifimosum]KAJ5146242.1 Translation elongation/initiation factor/Ribosomal beta-barrel [Penicillium bovifimosum]